MTTLHAAAHAIVRDLGCCFSQTGLINHLLCVFSVELDVSKDPAPEDSLAKVAEHFRVDLPTFKVGWRDFHVRKEVSLKVILAKHPTKRMRRYLHGRVLCSVSRSRAVASSSNSAFPAGFPKTRFGRSQPGLFEFPKLVFRFVRWGLEIVGLNGGYSPFDETTRRVLACCA